MKRKDKPVFAWIVRGDALVPEMDYDAKALDGYRDGDRVAVQIGHFRNLARLRAYWAMLHEVLEATECAPTVGCLHNMVKMGVGLTEEGRLPTGVVFTVPSSIAVDAMPEAEMVAYFAQAERWLAETYGWTGEEHRQHEASLEATSKPDKAPSELTPSETGTLTAYAIDLDNTANHWLRERKRVFGKEKPKVTDARMFRELQTVNRNWEAELSMMSPLARQTAKIIYVWTMEIVRDERPLSDINDKALPAIASGKGLK